MLTRFPGSEIAAYDQRYHDKAWLPTSADEADWIAGRLTWIVYNGPDGHSSLEILRNYEKALTDGRFEVLFSCKKSDCGKKFVRRMLDATGRMVGKGERWVPGTERYLAAVSNDESRPRTWVSLLLYERNNQNQVRIRLEIVEENEPRDIAALESEQLAGNTLNYDEARLAAGPTVKRSLSNVLDLEGGIDWRVNKFDPSVSAYELAAGTRKALREGGYTIEFQCSFDACGGSFIRKVIDLNNHPLPKGESWARDSAHYLIAKKRSADGLSYVSAMGYLHPKGHAKLRYLAVDTKDIQFNLISVNGESLADEIDATGKVAVYGVYFDTDSAELRPESGDALSEVGRLLALRPGLSLYIDGHTDSEGEEGYNQDLSSRRAQAVVDWLLENEGVEADRLQARGFGESQPVSDNASEEGRAWNRRVELVAR